VKFNLGHGQASLCTVFSASNYGGPNDGAYMQFLSKKYCNKDSTEIIGTDLCFNVFRYNIKENLPSKIRKNVDLDKNSNIIHLIRQKLPILKRSFEAADINNEKYITSNTWAAIMNAVTKIRIHWETMLPLLIPLSAIDRDNRINYLLFLDNLQNENLSSEIFEDVKIYFFSLSIL